eukprot:1721057-Amphidinium_carterae.1
MGVGGASFFYLVGASFVYLLRLDRGGGRHVTEVSRHEPLTQLAVATFGSFSSLTLAPCPHL